MVRIALFMLFAASVVCAVGASVADASDRQSTDATAINNTTDTVYIYVDGNHQATVPAGQSRNIFIYNVGYHTFKAVWPDGGSVTEYYYVPAEGLDWELYE